MASSGSTGVPHWRIARPAAELGLVVRDAIDPRTDHLMVKLDGQGNALQAAPNENDAREAGHGYDDNCSMNRSWKCEDALVPRQICEATRQESVCRCRVGLVVDGSCCVYSDSIICAVGQSLLEEVRHKIKATKNE